MSTGSPAQTLTPLLVAPLGIMSTPVAALLVTLSRLSGSLAQMPALLKAVLMATGSTEPPVMPVMPQTLSV